MKEKFLFSAKRSLLLALLASSNSCIAKEKEIFGSDPYDCNVCGIGEPKIACQPESIVGIQPVVSTCRDGETRDDFSVFFGQCIEGMENQCPQGQCKKPWVLISPACGDYQKK